MQNKIKINKIKTIDLLNKMNAKTSFIKINRRKTIIQISNNICSFDHTIEMIKIKKKNIANFSIEKQTYDSLIIKLCMIFPPSQATACNSIY